MTHQEAVAAICAELKRARIKWPKEKIDIIHAVNLLAEESGEALREANIHTYEYECLEAFKKEVIQAGAMALRILENIENLKANPLER